MLNISINTSSTQDIKEGNICSCVNSFPCMLKRGLLLITARTVVLKLVGETEPRSSIHTFIEPFVVEKIKCTVFLQIQNLCI